MLIDPIEEESLNSVLREVGLVKKKTTSQNTQSNIKDAFEQNDAGLTDAARHIAYLMRAAENETVRLRAAELALKVQGAFDDTEVSKSPTVNITILGNDQKTLINFLTP